MAEFFPLIVDGDQEHEKKEKDKKQRFSSINIATKKAVSSWLSPSEALSKSSLEHRMPVSVVAPELSKEQPYTPAAPTHYSEAWLGSAVRPPEYQVAAPALSHEAAKDDEEDDDNKEEGEEQSTGDLRQPQSEVHDRQESPAPVYAAEAIEPAKNPAEVQGPAEDDAFQRLLKRAGLDELSRSLEVAPEPSVSSGEEVSSNIPEMPAASNVGTGGNGGEEQPPSHDSAAEAGDPAEGRPTGAPVAAGAVRMPSAEQPRDVDHSEYILRTQARTRALVAFAAGLIIGNHF